MKRRMAQLPLHGGKAQPWLFRRMAKLTGAVAVLDEAVRKARLGENDKVEALIRLSHHETTIKRQARA